MARECQEEVDMKKAAWSVMGLTGQVVGPRMPALEFIGSQERLIQEGASNG
jgi:hypothetical protein